jgi:hypothetical protein
MSWTPLGKRPRVTRSREPGFCAGRTGSRARLKRQSQQPPGQPFKTGFHGTSRFICKLGVKCHLLIERERLTDWQYLGRAPWNSVVRRLSRKARLDSAKSGGTGKAFGPLLARKDRRVRCGGGFELPRLLRDGRPTQIRVVGRFRCWKGIPSFGLDASVSL